MPAGLPYFAWVEASETTFEAAHLRWDEQIFSFTLAQEEGDPASLTVVVQRPRNTAGDPIGLLGPGRKIWAWFALDCGDDLIRFRGRLVGIPTSIFEDLVTLEFIARPGSIVAQKAALADTLRVLPYYDEVVIDKERRDDPEVVLEGYSKIWHYDRESHVLTVSDEITGEDGLVEFDGASEDGKVLWDGLALTLTSGPLARVDIVAEYVWTQQARGGVDLTKYLTTAWGETTNGYIFLNAGDWPKPGSGIGDGWEVTNSSADDLGTVATVSKTHNSNMTIKSPHGSVSSQMSETTTHFTGSARVAGSVGPAVITNEWSTSSDEDGNWTSISQNYTKNETWIAENFIRPTLVAGYAAGRECTERVTLSLFADVQHVLTAPEDGEALRIDDIRSVNLSETLGEGSDAYVPMVDTRRRSYIATERGNQSVEHLIALARAHLLKRARVVEIAFAPKLSRMPEITLRKNAFLVEPRIGEALGKIVGYSIALDGADGRINCEVRIGCAIGRGGSAVAAGGTPTYCSIDYVGFDYQQFVGRTILFDTSVGYQPPNADPNDDGLNFLNTLTAEDVIEIPLTVEYGPEEEFPGQPEWGGSVSTDAEMDRSNYISSVVKFFEKRGTFKLISMTRAFSTDYDIQVTSLKVPTGYDLEAV